MSTVTIPQALATAMQHHQAGRLAEAEGIYRRILNVQPANADALHLLGVIASQVGRPEDAVTLIRQSLQSQPDVAAACVNLGNALQALRRLEEAANAYRRAIQLQPDFAEAHNNLGATLKEQGKRDEAIAAYRQAVHFKPDSAEGHSNLGVALSEQGRLDDAIAAYRRALQIRPDFAEAHYNLGNALRDTRCFDEGIAAYRRAIELRPTYAWACNNMAALLASRGRLDEAEAAYHRAIEFNPDFAPLQNNRGNLLKDLGRMDEAIACYQRAIQLQPDSATLHSNLLAALDYRPQITLAELFTAHSEYDRRHAAPLRSTWRRHDNSRDPDRRIRIGFISAHFGFHPVGRFLVRLLENLDPALFEIICYSDSNASDEMTDRIQAATAAWRVVFAMGDAELDQRIRDDGVDILFDLAGHTVGNRLLVFARKPAPIQIAWLDYAGTTGLTAIDYILADPHQIPPGAERWFSESVLRMPDDCLCYDPSAGAPPVGPLPALANGHVTFASFNALNKISPATIGAWARVLHGIPRARLLLKHGGLDSPATVSRFRELFAAHGIAADRVELLGWSPPHELLAFYNQVDVALDTFPYNGGLTTCEAIWMGVPVVTCPGEIFTSRHGLAHLSAAGVPETIASDLEHYVDIAVKLAADLPKLAALRAGLRAQVAASPLCDGRRFAAHFAGLLRGVWRQWCRQSPR